MAKSQKPAPAQQHQANNNSPKRDYLSQSRLPKRKLRDAMLLPQAILDNFGGRGAAPHQVAMAVNLSPTSSTWRDLTGSAVAYGLVEGGYNSARMAITDLGRRCVAPTVEGDEVRAKNEASLIPQLLRQFFEKYDLAKFPEDKIARNVLQHDLAVPSERISEALAILKDNGAYVGILHNTKTGLFVALNSPDPSNSISIDPIISMDGNDANVAQISDTKVSGLPTVPREKPNSGFKVFISHSKNMEVVTQVKDVLGLYDIEFEVAIEEETTAIPVPDKVRDAMRRCNAGVMVVTPDEHTSSGSDPMINNNVLIEIGAAFVLYNQHVVLLWDKRLKVPSNLQGLYRCEFEGNELSFAAGTKLAKSVKAFKSISVP